MLTATAPTTIPEKELLLLFGFKGHSRDKTPTLEGSYTTRSWKLPLFEGTSSRICVDHALKEARKRLPGE